MTALLSQIGDRRPCRSSLNRGPRHRFPRALRRDWVLAEIRHRSIKLRHSIERASDASPRTRALVSHANLSPESIPTFLIRSYIQRAMSLELPVPAVAPPLGSRLNNGGFEGESLSLLLEPNSRFFVRHELVLRPARNNGEPLSFRAPGDELDVIDVIETAVKNQTAIATIKKNDAVMITAIDVRPRDEMAVLLFRRSDPDATPPVFENRKTRKLRAVDKGPDDAEALSAHVFVHLDAKAKPHPAHRAIFEEVPGLGRTYIQMLLHDLITDVKYLYIDGRGEKRETYTIPKFEGLPSETLGAALKGGGIEYIELVRAPQLKGLDTAGIEAHPERMRLTVHAVSKKGVLEALERVRAWMGREHWERIRVLVRTDDDRHRVVEIARVGDAADVLFVRSERVATEKPLAQCTDVINEELAAHAKKAFANDKNW